jgi:hypothetical protein
VTHSTVFPGCDAPAMLQGTWTHTKRRDDQLVASHSPLDIAQIKFIPRCVSTGVRLMLLQRVGLVSFPPLCLPPRCSCPRFPSAGGAGVKLDVREQHGELGACTLGKPGGQTYHSCPSSRPWHTRGRRTEVAGSRAGLVPPVADTGSSASARRCLRSEGAGRGRRRRQRARPTAHTRVAVCCEDDAA